MREAIKSAQGLVPAQACQTEALQVASAIACHCLSILFQFFEGQEKKRKKNLPGGRSLTKKYTKNQWFFDHVHQN